MRRSGMYRSALLGLAAGLIGCAPLRPEWEPEIKPCQVWIVVDGRLKKCIPRSEVKRELCQITGECSATRL